MRRRSVPVLAILVLLTGGCALAGSGQAVVDGNGVGVAGPGVVGPGVVGPGMPFPECQNAELAFAGETTLAAVGLAEFAAGPDANRVGMIWITAGPAAVDQPLPAGEGKGAPMAAGRWVCVQWPDGSGMGGNIPDDWVLPATMGGTPATDEGTAELPIGMLAIVIGAVVLVGASVLAFRHEGA